MNSLTNAAIAPPQQKRSRATLEALLQAAESQLLHKAFADVTINNIVKAAGSSAGSFYARFPDKRALLHALHERFADRSISQMENFLADLGARKRPISKLAPLITVNIVAQHQENRGVLRAALMESLTDPAFAVRAIELVRRVSELIASAVDAPNMKPKQLSTEIELAILTIMATLDQELFLGAAPESQKIPAGRNTAQEIKRLCRLFLASLNLEHGGA